MKLDIAAIKKRWKPQAALALTVESNRIAVDFVRRENNELRIVESTSVAFGADDVLRGPEKVGQALAMALETAGIKERRCVVCVPPGWALSATTDLPEVSGEDLRGYLELRAEREFSISTSELRLAHCTYHLPDGNQRVTLAAIATKRLDSLTKMLEAAGCRAVSVSLGLERCLRQPEPAVYFLADGDHVDVVVTAGSGVAVLRSLSGVMPPEGASFDSARFGREIRITLGRLPDTMRKQVRQAFFQGPRPSAQLLCRELREPLTRLGIDSPDCNSTAVGSSAETANVAVAAAKSHLQDHPLPFEFVVPEEHRIEAMLRRYNTKRYRTIGGVAAALIILPIIAFAYRSHQESSLDAEWTDMRKDVTELETLQKKIREFRPWFDATPQSLLILEGLISSFPEQGDVWAKGIQIAEDEKVTCTGFTRSDAALTAVLDRLRARKDVTAVQRGPSRGNNPIQFSFSYKWEPSHDR